MSTDAAGPVRFGYADTPLGQLHYAEAGSGGIPVIALHQTPRSHDEFAELLPLLGPHHRIVAMDMYGFGQSAKPQGPQTIQQYASGVLALADSLGLDRFAVLGHHTGAVVAVEVAADAPGRVEAVILSSPAFTGPEYRAHHAGGPGVDDAEMDVDGAHLVTWWAQRAPYYPKDRPDILNRFIRDALAPGVDPLEGHLACARYVMEHRIGRVSAPVLILGGDADPFCFPDIEPMRQALTGAPSVEVAIIEGGMIPMLEQLPEPVAVEITRFLAGLPA
ncbi:pimeloyl-ACP methyl ester carboxylesterase [Mycobacterium frederiksbergense]|uniref:Pimeloyl-ACP methyl ester carboxylesterase n=1 Tax=Mycolicibacterium frederiksbergense TaxID=117567 RepID=A0ABT6L588_9MYCO|nr:alpha/beta hydrolase [Mycolicibacterium frederiksbergense]MDH6198119.1 pimeloyl-ACP methyl ester carboxylesterase [Mycolicibacterium frederiksbergense]